MATDPMQDMQRTLVFAANYPNLVQNQAPLEQLATRLSPEDKANLGKVGLNLDDPLSSSPESLRFLNGVLAQNPNAVQTLAALPPQARSEAFRACAQKGQKGVYDLGTLASGNKPEQPQTAAPVQPSQANPAPTTAQTAQQAAPAQQQDPSQASPQPDGQQTAGATNPSGASSSTPSASSPNPLAQMMSSNPEMANMMSRMTEMMQGLMGKLLTGLMGFLGKIFGGMNGSGGSLFAASNNPGSNNLGNALAIGGADQNQRVSYQAGDAAPQDTTVGALQQRGPTPGTTPPTPAFDPANRLGLNGPQMEPGRA